MKNALISIDVIGLGCPSCGEPISDPVNGSFMLTQESLKRLKLAPRKVTTCSTCGAKFRIPAVVSCLEEAPHP